MLEILRLHRRSLESSESLIWKGGNQTEGNVRGSLDLILAKNEAQRRDDETTRRRQPFSSSIKMGCVTSYLGDFPNRHVNDRFIPSFNNLSHADCKGKGLLAFILGGPKFQVQVAIFPITGTMDCDGLPSLWLDAIAWFQNLLGESHIYLIVLL